MRTRRRARGDKCHQFLEEGMWNERLPTAALLKNGGRSKKKGEKNVDTPSSFLLRIIPLDVSLVGWY